MVDPDPEPGQILSRYLDGYQVLERAEPRRGRSPDPEQARAGAHRHRSEHGAMPAGRAARASDWRERPRSRLPVLTCSLRTRQQIGQELGAPPTSSSRSARRRWRRRSDLPGTDPQPAHRRRRPRSGWPARADGSIDAAALPDHAGERRRRGAGRDAREAARRSCCSTC